MASATGLSRVDHAQRPAILHITADHPDSIAAAKTPVIARLVGLVEDRFDQHVYSLNRQTPSLSMRGLAAPPVIGQACADSPAHGAHVTPIRYTAPPAGVLHRHCLERLAEQLAEHIASPHNDMAMPDLLVGHKLTVEGFVVARLAQLLDRPYALSIQGNTDQKILTARPDLRHRLRAIYHGARAVFPFTPWARDHVDGVLGRYRGPSFLLPCPLAKDTQLAPVTGRKALLTVFHLAHYRLKNYPALVRAITLAQRDTPDLALSLVGGGPATQTAAVSRLHAAAPVPGLFSAEGALSPDAMAARFNGARGFILPSRRESFGLVFIEALNAGTPIAYPAGAAVDGYFDDLPFALRVDARDVRAIAQAARTLHRQETELKAELADWQDSEAAERFTRPRIAADFAAGLSAALAA